MACACKVNQQIDYITRKYGPKGPNQPQTHISMSLWNFIQNGFVAICSIALSPVILTVILFTLVVTGGKPLEIDKFFFK